ncbi:hypothetical protein HDV00_004330 [Rhizophlyctis rosea]|nr:hypothetical protein HDV00_004330 [Rhizophlyctis rosea]
MPRSRSRSPARRADTRDRSLRLRRRQTRTRSDETKKVHILNLQLERDQFFDLVRERKRKRKEKKHKKDRKKDKKKKDKKKKRKKDKKDSGAKVKNQWGAYGVLTPPDMYRKEAEFRAWLMEVKNISPEAVQNQGMKTYFAEYMEDFNTATLPHVKYYDLDKWEEEQRTRQHAELGDDNDTFDLTNDERNLASHSKALRSGKSMELGYSQEELAELKKVSEERIAADRLRKMGYQPKESMGVRYSNAYD